MNKYIASLFLFLCAYCLIGCSEETNMNKDYSKMLPGRMNLADAVRIGLKTESQSRAIEGEYGSAGLYKIDASGNISAVGVYFTTDTEGNRLEHEEYLHVAPEKLYNLSKNYMVAFFCKYYDKDGDLVEDEYYSKDNVEYQVHKEVPYQHLLIRKSDGKIWCIDNIFKELYSDSSYDLYPRCFLEDPNGVLHTCDGFRFNLDGLFPSYEQVFETKHYQYGCPDWDILDNGVRVSIYASPFGYGDEITFRWPQSGFQKLYPDDFNLVIKENYKFPLRKDLVVETSRDLQNSGKYTELYLEPSVRDTDCLIHIMPTGPLCIVPLKYVLKGKKLIDDVVVDDDVEVDNQYLSIIDGISRREIQEHIKNTCPWFLVFTTIVGNTPGSARLNPICEINHMPSITHRPDYDIRSWCSKGDELLINFSYYNKNDERHLINARFNIKSLEWKWFMEDVDVYFGTAWWDSEREISYDLIYENTKPIGIKWVNLKTMESGQNFFKITIPDYYKPGSPDENFILTFSGINPADGLEVEIKVDITTGEIVSSDIFEKNWALTYLISLN